MTCSLRGPSMAAVVGAALLVASPARAWTEAEVRSAHARVEAGRDGRAHVTFELDVSVRRGWLEGLEVAGLDPDLALDPEHPAAFVEAVDGPEAPADEAPADEAAVHTPELRVHDGGRVQFRFSRHDAPRQGTYRATFAYTTHLRATALRGDRVRLGWTFPAWRTGLDDVTVTMVAPAGARSALAETDAPSPVQVTREDTAAGTRITYRRPHLPRTVAWPVAVDLPASAVAPALRSNGGAEATPVTPGRAKTPAGGGGGPTPWVLASCLLAIALAKRWTFARQCEARRLRARPLVPLPGPARALACVAGAAAAVLLWRAAPATSLSLLGLLPLLVLERLPRPAAPRLGAFRRVRRPDRRRMRRALARHALLGPAAFDLGSPSGALVLAGAAALVLGCDPTVGGHAPLTAVHGLLLLVPLGLVATPRSLPLPAAVRLWRLARLARRLELTESAPPVAFELVVHEDGEGRWQDARLRCVLSGAPEGLLRLDLAVADRAERAERVAEPVLVAVARAGSMADGLLSGALRWHGTERAPGGRIARIARLHGRPDRRIAAAASSLTAWSTAEPAAELDPPPERAVA